jgi:hypothetical protein
MRQFISLMWKPMLLKTRWLGLIVMRYYGTTTRLLDWSKSAAIAAYFSVNGIFDLDGYIFSFSRKALDEY